MLSCTDWRSQTISGSGKYQRPFASRKHQRESMFQCGLTRLGSFQLISGTTCNPNWKQNIISTSLLCLISDLPQVTLKPSSADIWRSWWLVRGLRSEACGVRSARRVQWGVRRTWVPASVSPRSACALCSPGCHNLCSHWPWPPLRGTTLYTTHNCKYSALKKFHKQSGRSQ